MIIVVDRAPGARQVVIQAFESTPAGLDALREYARAAAHAVQAFERMGDAMRRQLEKLSRSVEKVSESLSSWRDALADAEAWRALRAPARPERRRAVAPPTVHHDARGPASWAQSLRAWR